MSAGYAKTTWPQKCFNAQNNWLMGWFMDRALDLPLRVPSIYKLATFVDYDKTASDEVVLIRIDQSIYLQYNRAKDFNRDTEMAQNQVTVTEYTPGFPGTGTSLLAGLDITTGPFQVTPIGKTSSVVMEVCQFIPGNEYTADVAIVSVGVGRSLCYEQKLNLVTASPISPSMLQSPSRSPIYFQPTSVIDENFPTVVWDGEPTPRLHKRPHIPDLNLTRFINRSYASTAASLSSLVGLLVLLQSLQLM
jgi:hypothetical protein